MSRKKPTIDRQQVLALVTDLQEAREKRAAALAEKAVLPLPPIEQEALELLAIIYAPVSKTAFAACLNKVGIRNADGRQFLPAHAEALLLPLVRSGKVRLDGLGFQLAGQLAHRLTLAAIAAGRFAPFAAAVQQEIAPQGGWGGGKVYYRLPQQALRDLRIALYRPNLPEILRLLRICQEQAPDDRHPFLELCLPLDGAWLDQLPYMIYLLIMSEILNAALQLQVSGVEAFAHFAARYEREATQQEPFARQIYATELLLRGRVTEARMLLQAAERPDDLSLLAWIEFLRGNDEQAIEQYNAALTVIKREQGKRKYFLTDIPGLFFIPALLRAGTPDRLKQAEEHAVFVAGKREWNFWAVYYLVSQVLAARRGVHTAPRTIDELSGQLVRHGSPLQVLFSLLAQHWTGGSLGKALARVALPMVARLELAGLQLLADELAQVCEALGAGKAPAAAARYAEAGLVPLSGLMNRRSSWEAALTALVRLGNSETLPAATTVKGESRLVWVVTEIMDDLLEIEPREQKLLTSGRKWTAGRAVSLKKLKEGVETISFLTPDDRKVCGAIVKERSYYYRRAQESFRIDQAKALPLLIGHPLVFVDDEEMLPLEIVSGEPELRVRRKKDGLQLALHPQPDPDAKCLFSWETRTRLKIVELTPRIRQVAEIVGGGLLVPLAAEQKVLEALGAVSSLVTVHSDISGGAANIEERVAEPLPLVLLTPYGDGLRIEMKVRPLGEGGPFFTPGYGGASVIAELAGLRLQVRRDLQQELTLAGALMARLPLAGAEEEANGIWLFPEPVGCLELLAVLQSVTAEEARVVWPEGEKLRISRQQGLKQMQLKVRQAGDWFQLEGELALDDGEVLELRRILELLPGRVGRFVPLGEGRFLALTEQFRKRLEELRSFTDLHGKGVRCTLPALAVLDEVADGMGGLTGDKGWRQQLALLREAETLQPVLPSTLQAELREYQQEGYSWLCRLAHWGGGACLADDMGLGKTIQALALILARAAGGPTLVVAPTSVCMNWEVEAQRFAPTLNLQLFGSGARQQQLDRLAPFDLVICSYGLLQQEAEMLQGVTWQTIVLDEAQAIKNMATKRSQAAMALNGGFRLITTGTPVENHLGELWNLFRFINPGLLGSHRSFNDRFALPIERDKDKGARERLKKLIRPFILRRTKSQVLTELPPRTEITLQVELSKEEAAFYEAVRRNALEKIAGSKGPEGEKHLRILAEIMRLRRACCHPRLVLPDSPLEGAKLAACLELIAELRDNGHKALVFSQFVDHLALVRSELDQRGISYQYLDGATSPPERKRRVEAFQAGNGDLFLISLKAGGTGLNLTAADYVIHLDPWWNPAVEDQASDRAHRIGQTRPVTVYRLVARHSIEEKIIALHQTKRDLADSLLEGTEGGTRISADELLALLRDA